MVQRKTLTLPDGYFGPAVKKVQEAVLNRKEFLLRSSIWEDTFKVVCHHPDTLSRRTSRPTQTFDLGQGPWRWETARLANGQATLLPLTCRWRDLRTTRLKFGGARRWQAMIPFADATAPTLRRRGNQEPSRLLPWSLLSPKNRALPQTSALQVPRFPKSGGEFVCPVVHPPRGSWTPSTQRTPPRPSKGCWPTKRG